MKTKLIISIVAIFVLIVFSCKKELEIPAGGNKIEFGETKTDSIAYFTTKITTTVTATGGNEITQHGHCWSTEQEPTIEDSHTTLGKLTQPKTFTSELTELIPNTNYYIRSYITYKNGTAYGIEQNIRTLKTGIPVVSTSGVTNITLYTAQCGGNAIADSGLTITSKGVCWDTIAVFTIESNLGNTNDGDSLGAFTSNISGLQEGVNYFVKAYAANDKGTSYGEVLQFSTVPITIPEVTTTDITDITINSAQSGGTVTSNGDGTVSARGIVWSTNQYPTIDNNDGLTENGSGLGSFTSNLTNLQDGIFCYVRSYATNEKGTAYGEQKSFQTVGIGFPILTTNNVIDVTATTASCGGNITSAGNGSVTARGICWNLTGNPTLDNNINFTTDGSGIGNFSSSLTGLIEGTQYYVVAYATNETGTAYGTVKSFTTVNINAPTVTTTSASNVTTSSATAGGNVTDGGNQDVTQRGVCWNTNNNPTLENSLGYTIDGTGTGNFVSSINDLMDSTLYYFRAYAINIEGTGYGEIKQFTTIDINLPTVTTNEITNITNNSATSGGNVTNDGNSPVTARGVCWSTTNNPTISNSHTTNGIGTGTFISNITGLTEITEYYARAYATNSEGTAYGNEVVFTTLTDIELPTVTTDNAINITDTTATSGGNVTSDGGAEVTARGVCWSINNNPTLADSYTTDGTGTGTFVSDITGLSENTMYYVRAYATNSEGTAYGNEITFITLPDVNLPTVTTDEATNITQTTATSGGEVIDDGGANITARGVCWSINCNPTLADSYTTDGTGTGIFVSDITGLSENTQYYVRAYATNSEGTAYGNEIIFITLSNITLPSVTTDDASNITSVSATSGGNVTDDGGADVTARGVCWSTSSNPTITDNHTIDGVGTGTFVSDITGLTENTLYYVRAYATNSVGTGYGNEISFTTLVYVWQCGDIINYSGQTYNTIEIGTQCWFKENLNVGIRINSYQYPSDNGQIEKFCYDDDEANCDNYGGLYQWDEMMQYTTSQGVQGICPTGWHIPTDDEWKTLEGTVDSQYGVGDPEWDGTGERGFDAGENLKSTSGWNNSGNGTDIYSFTGLPSGAFSMSQQVFFGIGETGWLWTSSQNVWSTAWHRTLHFSYDGVSRGETVLTSASRSLRCIMD